MRSKCLVVLVLLVIPSISLASSSCSSIGYTVATINGVFTDQKGAEENLKALTSLSPTTQNSQPIDYHYLLNNTHLAGVGDILESVYQGLYDEDTVSTYDLVEILKSASEKVATQKLLLVAHSQGNFYSNSFYDTLADKVGGIPAQSLGIYGVAVPSNRIAGGGKYLTSDTDNLIAGVVKNVPYRQILMPNTHINWQAEDDPNGLGHSFSGIYLKYRSDRIVADIKESLAKLKPNDVQQGDQPCIAPPEITLAHKAIGLAYTVADPIANGVVAVHQGVSAVFQPIAEMEGNIIAAVGAPVSLAVAPYVEQAGELKAFAENPFTAGLPAEKPKIENLHPKETTLPMSEVELRTSTPAPIFSGFGGFGGGGLPPSQTTESSPSVGSASSSGGSSSASAQTETQTTPSPTPPPSGPCASVSRTTSDLATTSLTILQAGDITSDLTLRYASSTYEVPTGILLVKPGVTLTIEPGVVVKFVNSSSGITVQGTLLACGTADLPVVFTTLTDDTYGGNLSGATTPGTVTAGGSWHGLSLAPGGGTSILSHVIIRGSGSEGQPALLVNGVSPVVTDSTFEYGSGGVSLFNSTATLLRSTIRNQTTQDFNASGILVSGGAPDIEDNVLSANFIGLTLSGSSAVFRNNTITGSMYRAAFLSGLRQSVIEGNKNSDASATTPPSELMLLDTLTTAGATSTLGVNGIPYAIDLSSAKVVAGSGLVLSPGITMRFSANALLDVFGTIQVGGTSASTTLSSLGSSAGLGIEPESGAHGTFTRVEPNDLLFGTNNF